MKKIQSKTHKKIFNKSYLVLGLVVIVALVGFFIKKMLVSPQIALIAEPSKQMCVSNISSMSFHDECTTPGTFRRAIYTCSNGATAEKLASGTNCISYNDIMKEAQNNCGQSCVESSPSPTCVPNPCPGDGRTCKLAALPPGQSYCPIGTAVPAPSLLPSPTPYPTLAPPSPSSTPISSSMKCKPRVFKLKEGDDPKANPMLYATSDREIEHGSQRVKEGEYYAFLIEATSFQSMSVATVSASTQNLHGFDEPIEYYAAADFCKIEAQNKYLSCFKGPYQFKANIPVLLPVGGTFKVTNEITRTYNTSILIKPYYITNGSSWDSNPCTIMMLAADNNTPTPTPVPTTAPGCYTEQRFCIQSLVGGKCPAATVCPVPTPTPTPTPVPSPVYSSKPSATPTPISCGTTLNKWQFRESCGTNMYRYIDFNCSGTTASQVFGNPNICKSETEWVAEARTACMNATCVSPIPTPQTTTNAAPIATLAPRSVTRQSFAQCFKTCRDNKRRAMSCVRYCMR